MSAALIPWAYVLPGLAASPFGPSSKVKSLVVVWGPFVVRGQWVSVGGVSGWSSWSLLVVWHCLRVSGLR